MQHHTGGSWYLPWGDPLQKVINIPFHHPGASASIPAAMTPYSTLTGHQSSDAAACQVISNQHQQHSFSSVMPLESQAATPHIYRQQSALQSADSPRLGSLGRFQNSNALQLHITANGTGSAAVLGTENLDLQNSHAQTFQNAATVAMFAPLSLRSFISHVSNPLISLATQKSSNVSSQQITCMQPSASSQHQLSTASAIINLNLSTIAMQHHIPTSPLQSDNIIMRRLKKLTPPCEKDKLKIQFTEKRKAEDLEQLKVLKKAKLETKALKAKRPGFTDERYQETSYYIENGLRKVYPYFFTFTTFTKGRWVGEKILDVFAREFRAHPAKEYERCIKAGTLTVNYENVSSDYQLKHNDLLANIVHRHEVPVTSQSIAIVHIDDDIVVVNKPASIPVHPCGRYRHNTIVFILAKEYNLKNLRTIHRLDRLTSGLLLFGRSPKKARQMEHQIRNRQVQKEYICRVEGNFPDGDVECKEPIEVVSYKIGVCKVSIKGKDCTTTFKKIAHNGKTSIVLCKPLTGRMHQIRVHLQYLGYPVINDPLYNHKVFGPLKGRGGDIGGKTDEELICELINIHNAENWLGIDGDSDLPLFGTIKVDSDADGLNLNLQRKSKDGNLSDDESEEVFCETSKSQKTTIIINENPNDNSREECSPEPDCNSCLFSMKNDNENIHIKNTIATQTGHESPDMDFNIEKMTSDKHCYECKVRYRDPKPKDLVMYLHAWKYKGPGWGYETELPNWANIEWTESESD